MSVLIETSVGELVVDLYVDECPLATKNFLKLCKIKYYNGCLFFNVQENFMVQTGDPTGTGKGGKSVYGQLYGDQAMHFEDEIRPQLKHDKKGLLGMASAGPNLNGSQFYITTRGDELEYLDGKHTIFGEVAEGMDVLDQINALFVDDEHRPYQDVRIKHTYILDDPFPDPDLLVVPPESPQRERPEEEAVETRLAYGEPLDEYEGRTEQEIEQSVRDKEAKSRAVVLEMIGDIPDADVKPPEEVLFVCKLNPVTESSDLDMAFCRFGPCKSEVIRDYKTGDSLCYAFIEFTDKKHCEEAYFKMNNVLLDDRRIKVDFSQSVAKLWNKFARRPWEKHSKGDGDPYASEKKKSNRREFGDGNLRLKTHTRRDADKYDLVDEPVEQPHRRHRRSGNEDSKLSHREREYDDHDRQRKHRKTSPERRDRNKKSSRSRSRDGGRSSRKRSSSRERERNRRNERSRSRDRDENRKGSRSSNGSGSSRHHPHSSRKRSSSRSRDRDNHRRRERR